MTTTRLPYRAVCTECDGPAGSDDDRWKSVRRPSEAMARIARDIHNRETHHDGDGAEVVRADE